MRRALAGAAALLLLGCMTALPVSARTAEDVANKARELGIPETQVQAAYNDMLRSEHDEAWYDAAYEELVENIEEVKLQLAERYGIPGTTAVDETPVADDNTLYAADGTPVERISEAAFCAMTYEEMQAYIASLDDASKRRFMDSLSAKERGAMAKALPATDQAGLADLMVKAADTLGMQVTVDHIGGGQLDMTVRDSNGIVIDQTAFGTVIDETGISHTKQLVTAALGMLVSLAGFGFLAQKMRPTE